MDGWPWHSSGQIVVGVAVLHAALEGLGRLWEHGGRALPTWSGVEGTRGTCVSLHMTIQAFLYKYLTGRCGMKLYIVCVKFIFVKARSGINAEKANLNAF